MLEKVFVTSLICLAIHVMLKPGMLLGLIGEIMELFLKDYVNKPLGLCLTCMASIYGTIVFFTWSNLPITDYIPFILSVAGLNYFFSLIISILEIFDKAQEDQSDYDRQIYDN